MIDDTPACGRGFLPLLEPATDHNRTLPNTSGQIFIDIFDSDEDLDCIYVDINDDESYDLSGIKELFI